MSSESPAAERRRVRREEAAELREAGRSARQIAAALGCSAWTVRSDLKAAGAWEPTLVTGRDGRAYPGSLGERKKRRAEKRKAEQAEAEQKAERGPAGPVTVGCRYCAFTATVDADAVTPALHAKHVCDRPPPQAVSARSRPRGRGFRTRK